MKVTMLIFYINGCRFELDSNKLIAEGFSEEVSLEGKERLWQISESVIEHSRTPKPSGLDTLKVYNLLHAAGA